MDSVFCSTSDRILFRTGPGSSLTPGWPVHSSRARAGVSELGVARACVDQVCATRARHREPFLFRPPPVYSCVSPPRPVSCPAQVDSHEFPTSSFETPPSELSPVLVRTLGSDTVSEDGWDHEGHRGDSGPVCKVWGRVAIPQSRVSQ